MTLAVIEPLIAVLQSLSNACAVQWWKWILALVSAPIACYAIGAALTVVDMMNRRSVRKFHERWPFATRPHVRATLVSPPSSEIEKWHLVTDEGRQRWVFDDTPSAPPHTFVESYHLGLTEPSEFAVTTQPKWSANDALRAGAKFLIKLQHPKTGHWPNDYSGPMFLLPGAIIVKFLVHEGNLERMFKFPQQRVEFIRYLENMQNDDGGWGMHTESHSTMFGTVLNYVTIRLLGVAANANSASAARNWILQRGGAQSIPSWGKVWLCVLGVYSYEGINSIPPELALLPDSLPISQGKFWCHSRIVTTPFSWLYGKRWQPKFHPTLEALKAELYSTPFESINWPAQRSNIYELDVYTPHSAFYKLANAALLLYEKFHSKTLRARACDLAWEHIKYDDESTNFICLGPVNKVLDMLVTWVIEGNASERFQKHEERLEDYFYIGHDGMRMSGYNGSQLWDTSFAVQALAACRLEEDPEFIDAVAQAHDYIEVAQVREDPPQAAKFYRHRTKGAWNFSTRAQSWQVSDCTAEGLRVVLLLRGKSLVTARTKTPFDEERIFDAVDEILSLRNVAGDGGWASYEPSRGPRWLELLNCAEVYKDIMIDYSYAECSSSCIHTLCLFRKQFPNYKSAEIAKAIKDGVACVLSKQNVDGSFYGSWAVCFTYAAWLVAEALQLTEQFNADSPVFVRLCAFLLSKQRDDGGWGEDFNACVRQVWVENPDGSQVVNTAWAVMALMIAGGPKHRESVERGIQFIVSRQLATGDWAQERISGVFNGNAAIHYPGYKNSMPVWALGHYMAWKSQFAQ